MNLKSAPATIVLGAFALVLLAALGWVGLIGPALGDLGETGEARTAAQDRNHKMRLDLARLRAQAEDLPASDALAADLDTLFPPTADQPGFFAQLAAITDDAGIPARDVAALSPGVPVVPGDPASAGTPVPTDPAGTGTAETAETASVADVAVQDVEVQVKGDYEALTEVLQGIERMPRAFLLDTVSLVDDTEVGEGFALTVTGRTFVAPPLRPASGP